MSGPHPAAPHRLPPPCPVCADLPGSPHGTPAPPAATPGQRAYAVMHRASGVDVPHEDLGDDDKRLWDDIAQAVLNGAFPGLKRELAKAREQLATTQAIARMLQATAIEILAAYQSGTVVSDELAGIWRERLGGDHA